MASVLVRNGSFFRKFISIHKIRVNLKIHQEITTFRNFHLSSCLEKIVSFNLSDIGEGIREVTIKEWFVKEGDTVEQFENLCEVQSDKASVTITSRYDGKIIKIYHEIDEIAHVGKPLIDFEVADDDENKWDTSDSSSSSLLSNSNFEKKESFELLEKSQKKSKEECIRPLATPAVRRIAMENKVDLSKVAASGKQGRVLKGDVLEYLGKIPVGTNKPHSTTTVTATNILPSDRVEVLKGIRKAMLKSMTESLKIPHFAYSEEIDMSNLIELRNSLREESVKRGVSKLTFMPFCIKGASLALTQYPILNSSLDLDSESIVYKGSHNISVAIDTEQGLVVPNVKNCQIKSILQIAKDLQNLLERARTGNLKPEDFADGTFSLSNIGIIGGTYTHPCILPPQVAIGAIGKVKTIPIFGEDNEIIKGHIMCVSWCADHRVIDGVTMAKFSNLWKKYIENPYLFLLN